MTANTATQNKTPRFVLVTGVTGQQGGAVARALLARGHRVRGLTRSTDSPAAKALAGNGGEVVAGDFTDPDSLVRAAEGVDAVYAMSTPFEAGMEAETAQGLAVIDAARRAGAGHLVYSSVASADRDTGIPHFESKYAVEEVLVDSGVPHTIMAPVAFMENLLQPWTLSGLKEGKLALALPGTRALQQIAVADIGAFAAALIERREAVFGRRFDIAGDELTGDEMAAILSEVMGRTIRYEGFPPDVLRVQGGPAGEDVAIMFEWFDHTGYAAPIAGLRQDFPEVDWHDFARWARLQRWPATESTPA